MAFTGAVVLKGNLKIGTVAPPALDVSDQVLGYTIAADRDVVSIPATLATPKGNKAGGVGYSLKIDFLSSDGSATDDLFRILWTSLATPDGVLFFSGSMRDGAIAATNPEWQGSFIVTGAALGGTAEDYSHDSRTFPMTGAPVIDITP